MTLFQHVAIWSLRALALWAAFELAAVLFDEGVDRANSGLRLHGHQAAMTRLVRTAETLEREAAVADAQIAGLSAGAWRIAVATPDAQAAPIAAGLVREELMALGAQAPVVETSETVLSGPLRQLHLTLRWRENAGAAPAILYALSARRGDLHIRALRLTRDDALVLVEAEAVALVRVDAGR